MDLDKYLLELKQYRNTSTSLSDWIDTTRQRQDALQGAKFNDITVLTEHIKQQKVEAQSVIKQTASICQSVCTSLLMHSDPHEL